MIAKKQILYIEDNPGDVRLFEKMVSNSMMSIEVSTADKLETGMEMVCENNFDAIFMDLGLPDSQGIESMKTLIESCVDTPVIVLTGHHDEDVGVQAIQAGAQDYLVKGIDYSAMFHRIIQNAIERKDIEDRLRTSEERVLHLNAVLHAIRDVNQLITHESLDRYQLIQDVCNNLTRALDFHNAWIVLLDEKGKYLKCVNSGFNNHFQPLADQLANGILHSCIKKALEQDKVVVIKDTHIECPDCPISIDYRSRSTFIIQLQSHGTKYGVFEIGVPTYFIDNEEVQDLFSEMASDIAFALYKFDVEDHRKEAEEKIRASLIEKEMLLKEIHHRVKNNLQVITSLLNLQSANISDQQVLKVFRESQQRIHSIALVHEKLYKSENLSEIDFNSYATSIVQELMRAYNVMDTVSIKVDINDVFIGIDNAIPLGLIINELITNAIKYAFPNQRHGHITIKINKVSDYYELSVSDDGVGLNKDVILKDKGLGLQLVGILAEQLGGHLQIDCENGSRFTLQFPIVQL
ncbi:histidine kinase dimerization/phosphoacceptor domain -containing protein [bacterium]